MILGPKRRHVKCFKFVIDFGARREQVLSLEDVEDLLGPRPFQSEELRNIDRYRKGFQAAQEAEVSSSSSEGTTNDQSTASPTADHDGSGGMQTSVSSESAAEPVGPQNESETAAETDREGSAEESGSATGDDAGDEGQDSQSSGGSVDGSSGSKKRIVAS